MAIPLSHSSSPACPEWTILSGRMSASSSNLHCGSRVSLSQNVPLGKYLLLLELRKVLGICLPKSLSQHAQKALGILGLVVPKGTFPSSASFTHRRSDVPEARLARSLGKGKRFNHLCWKSAALGQNAAWPLSPCPLSLALLYCVKEPARLHCHPQHLTELCDCFNVRKCCSLMQ